MMRHSIFTVAGGLLLVALAGRFLSDTNADDSAERLNLDPGLHAADGTSPGSDEPGVERLLDGHDSVAHGVPSENARSSASRRPAAADVHREIARDLLEPLSSDPMRVGDQRREVLSSLLNEQKAASAQSLDGTSNAAVSPGDGGNGSRTEQITALEHESEETPAVHDPASTLSAPTIKSGERTHMAAVSAEEGHGFSETAQFADIESQTSALPMPRPRDDGALASQSATLQANLVADLANDIAAGSPEIREAQQQLTRLGYDPGQVDGVPGPQTRKAVRTYQRSLGAKPDGVVTGHLLAALHKDVIARDASRSAAPPAQTDLIANRTAPKPKSAARSGDVAEIRNASKAKPRPQARENKLKTWVAAATREIQRAIGREFNSIKQPRTLRTYCRANPETWVYDEGRREMVLCKKVADQLSAHLSPRSSRAIR